MPLRFALINQPSDEEERAKLLSASAAILNASPRLGGFQLGGRVAAAMPTPGRGVMPGRRSYAPLAQGVAGGDDEALPGKKPPPLQCVALTVGVLCLLSFVGGTGWAIVHFATRRSSTSDVASQLHAKTGIRMGAAKVLTKKLLTRPIPPPPPEERPWVDPPPPPPWPSPSPTSRRRRSSPPPPPPPPLHSPVPPLDLDPPHPPPPPSPPPPVPLVTVTVDDSPYPPSPSVAGRYSSGGSEASSGVARPVPVARRGAARS